MTACSARRTQRSVESSHLQLQGTVRVGGEGAGGGGLTLGSVPMLCTELWNGAGGGIELVGHSVLGSGGGGSAPYVRKGLQHERDVGGGDTGVRGWGWRGGKDGGEGGERLGERDGWNGDGRGKGMGEWDGVE